MLAETESQTRISDCPVAYERVKPRVAPSTNQRLRRRVLQGR